MDHGRLIRPLIVVSDTISVDSLNCAGEGEKSATKLPRNASHDCVTAGRVIVNVIDAAGCKG
jgi:hypothetical protein